MPKKYTSAKLAKLKKFDLNLLDVFEMIFNLNSVTLTASRLDRSPSAVSQSLGKLRIFFDDPLFIREGTKLIPTPVAIDVHNHLCETFPPLLDGLLSGRPGGGKSKFSIYTPPYIAMRILPDICRLIEDRNIDCELDQLNTDANTDNHEDILIFKKADITIDTRENSNSSSISELYLEDKVVAICRKDHPRLKSTLKLKEMHLEKYTGLNFNEEGLKKISKNIANKLINRNIIFQSNSLLVNIAITETTDYISFIPEWLALKLQNSFNIKILNCDFPIGNVSYYISYNRAQIKSRHFSTLINIFNSCKDQA